MAFANCFENLHVRRFLLQYWWHRMVPYIRINDLIENWIYIDTRGRLPLDRCNPSAYHHRLISTRLSASASSLPPMSLSIFYTASDCPSHPRYSVLCFLFAIGDIFSDIAHRADLLSAGGGLDIRVAGPCRRRSLPRV